MDRDGEAEAEKLTETPERGLEAEREPEVDRDRRRSDITVV